MPTARVNDSGSVLYYEDSGQPKGSKEYVTVVLIHGFIFHGAIFHRLLPYAEAYNLRLVFLNLRDYPGSSRFTSEELEAFRHPDDCVKAAVLRALGREIAVSLEYIMGAYNLPAISHIVDQRTGGMAVLAWSYGNVFTMSMLADAGFLPERLQKTLCRYLRTVIMYDSSVTTIGVKPAEGSYHPLRDASLTTLRERGQRFREWISCYRTAVSNLDTVTEAALSDRRTFSEVANSRQGDRAHMPSVLRMTLDEYACTSEPSMVERSFASTRLMPREVYHENLRRALFDTGGTLMDVNVLVIWCDMSTSDCLWAAKRIEDMHQSLEGESHRKIEFAKMNGGNHFAHWDNPENFLRLLTKHIT